MAAQEPLQPSSWRRSRKLTDDDHVVVEATGNASAVAEVIRPHVRRVVVACG
jgi:phosphosulfolactate phosphohydrolase-like enzyme